MSSVLRFILSLIFGEEPDLELKIVLNRRGVQYESLKSDYDSPSELGIGAGGTQLYKSKNSNNPSVFYKDLIRLKRPQDREKWFNAFFFYDLAQALKWGKPIEPKIIYKYQGSKFSNEGKMTEGVSFTPFYKLFKEQRKPPYVTGPLTKEQYEGWQAVDILAEKDKEQHPLASGAVERVWQNAKYDFDFDKFGLKDVYNNFVYDTLASFAKDGRLGRYMTYAHLLGLGDPNVDNFGLLNGKELIMIDVDHFGEMASNTAFSQKSHDATKATRNLVSFIPKLRFKDPFNGYRFTYTYTDSPDDVKKWLIRSLANQSLASGSRILNDTDSRLIQFALNNKNKIEIINNIQFEDVLNVDGYREFISQFGPNMGLFPNYLDLYKPLFINEYELEKVTREIISISPDLIRSTIKATCDDLKVINKYANQNNQIGPDDCGKSILENVLAHQETFKRLLWNTLQKRSREVEELYRAASYKK